jgi:hypothetical protein
MSSTLSTPAQTFLSTEQMNQVIRALVEAIPQEEKTSKVSRPKVPAPKPFTGKENAEEAMAWLERMKHYIVYFPWTSNSLNVVFAYFQEDAADWATLQIKCRLKYYQHKGTDGFQKHRPQSVEPGETSSGDKKILPNTIISIKEFEEAFMAQFVAADPITDIRQRFLSLK